MTVFELLQALHQRKIQLHLVDDKLQINAPKGAMNEALLAALKANKQAVIDQLKHSQISQQLIPAADRSGPLLLSYAQQRLWFIDQMEQGSAHYNTPGAMAVTGQFNVAVAEQAFRNIIQRHEPLRTVYEAAEPESIQLIRDDYDFQIKQHDLTHLSAEAQQVRIDQALADDTQQPFDLTADVMLRVAYWQTSPTQGVLLFNMHHIAADGWSIAILVDEFVRFYRAGLEGKKANLPPLAIQYADYAQWQRSWLADGVLEQQLAYWEQQLAGLPLVHDLPLDHQRPPKPTFQGGIHHFTVDAQTFGGLQQLAQQHQCTVFMLFHAAFALLLSRLSGQNDIVIGTPVANRRQAELEPLIGFFVNTLVLRADCRPELSVSDFLQQIKHTNLNAQAHQDVPFEHVVERLNPPRSAQHNALFQIMLTMDNNQAPDLDLPQVSMQAMENPHLAAKFDLLLNVQDNLTNNGDGMGAWFEYSRDLFKPATIHTVANGLCHLLKAMVATPQLSLAELPLLDPSRQQALWQQLKHPAAPDQAVPLLYHQQFERQVSRTPDHTAVICADQRLSYSALNHRANQLAHWLAAQGCVAGNRVGLCLHPSCDLLVAVLACSKSSCSFVPLEPTCPEHQLLHTIKDANLVLILTDDLLPDATVPIWTWRKINPQLDQLTAEAIADPNLEIHPEQEVYSLYTSGSTGTPKGVMITHRGLANYLNHVQTAYWRPALIGAVVSSPLCLDDTLTSLLGPILVGGQVEMLPLDDDLLPALEQRLFASEHEWLFKVTPAHLNAVAQSYTGSPVSSAHHLVIGGEQLTSQTLRHWLTNLLPGATYTNEYGSTETVVAACAWSVNPSQINDLDACHAVPIGQAIQNTQLYILNEALQAQLPGFVGELYIAGDGLAMGYINQAESTARQFIDNPFAEGLMYKTGDLVRLLDNGALQFVGRTADPVRFGGFHIGLSELEQTLSQHQNIHDAVVVLHPSADAGPQLLAYLVPRVGHEQSTQSDELLTVLKHQLAASLPTCMQPSHWCWLPRMPLTIEGKVDRLALPLPDINDHNAQTTPPAEPPVGHTEQTLAAIWVDVLSVPVDELTRQADFFALGGHSLLTVRLIAAIRARLGVELTVRQVFENAQLKTLAALIQQSQVSQRPPITNILRDQKPIPCSYAQQRLWFIDQLNDGSSQYNTPGVIQVTGDFDVSVAEQAFNHIIQRHETLRTVFMEGREGPWQKIQAEFDFSITLQDLSHLSEAEQVDAIQQAAKQDAATSFKLDQDLMLRISYLKQNEAAGVLLFNMHHIASDGWSVGVLIKEFMALYQTIKNGESSDLPALTIQYADFAHWQRQWLSGDVLSQQLDYWQHQLADLPQVHSLPLDHARPETQRHLGARFHFSLTPQLSDALQQLAVNNQVTQFMLMHAVFAVVLSRFANNHDIVIGTPVANRTQQELEALIGFFVNTLVLRVDCGNNPAFTDFLADVKRVNLEAQANQDVPFEHLVDRLNPTRSSRHNALFQIMLSMDTHNSQNLTLPGVELKTLNSEQVTTKFDLSLFITQQQPGSLIFEYNTDLFKGQTIERLATALTTALEAVVEQPSQGIATLPILGASERAYLLQELNDTAVPHPRDLCIHELIEQQVARSPNQVAVVCKDRSLTYDQLNSQANQLAHFLVEQGVQADDFVGLCVERSLEMMVGLLAILKAGGGYLPLDPSYPKERLEHMLQDSRVQLLLTQRHVYAELEFDQQQVICIDDAGVYATQPTSNIDKAQLGLSAANLAYIIYTSGSTGKPKGAAVEHQNETNLLYWYTKEYALEKNDKVLIMTAIGFDLTQKNLFAPLICGASVQFATARYFDVNAITAFIARQQITFTNCAPSVFYPLVEHDHHIKQLASLRCVLFGGESIAFDRLAAWMQAAQEELQLINMYGPTECTDISCAYRIPVKQINHNAPIGTPNDNVKLYVLNEYQQLAPLGTAGELCVGGWGVSRGYLNQPELTAEKFIPNPFATDGTELIYRTGDAVVWNRHGQLEFIGRIDNQIKIRGFRVELGEIEAKLNQHPAIKQSVVLHDAAQQTLHAYLVTAQDARLKAVDLRQFLSQFLPDYMVPSKFVLLDELPLTTHGKIDKKALVGQAIQEHSPAQAAPQNHTETLLQQLWAELLLLDQSAIGTDQNFFELGGHSLLLTNLLHRVAETLGVQLRVKDVFHAPTIREMAALMLTAEASRSIPNRDPNRPVPLSYGQYRIWFIEQLKLTSNEHNMAVAAKIKGRFQVTVLQQALNDMIARHEILRTHVDSSAEQPSQVISANYQYAIEVIDLSQVPPSLREAEVARLTHLQDTRVFDLSALPLFSVLLLKTDVDEYVFHFNQHHLISDGWSQQLFYQELMRRYHDISNGLNTAWPAQPFSYADYACWQQHWQDSEEAAEQRQFWRHYLQDCQPHFILPMQQPTAQLDAQQNLVEVQVDASIRQQLKTLGQQHQGSLFNVLHTAFAVLLGRLSGAKDFNLGVPVTGRHMFGTQHMLGMFLNTLPVRHQLDLKASFANVLAGQIDNLAQVLSNQDLPLEQILELTQCERMSERTPLFQILFNMLSVPDLELDDSTLDFKLQQQDPAELTNKFNLTLYLKDSAQGIKIYCHYNSALFTSEQVRIMLEQYTSLLSQLAFDVDKPCLAYALNRGLAHVNYDQQLLPDDHETLTDVTALFRSQAKQRPQALAIQDATHGWRYHELWSFSYGLALELRAAGVRKGDVVAIMAARQANLIPAILASLQLGAAYAVLTPEMPQQRMQQQLQIINNPVTLMCEQTSAYDAALLDIIGAHSQLLYVANQPQHYGSVSHHFAPETNLLNEVACVTFTSGSSGVPKAVQGTHLGLCGYLQWLPQKVGFQASDHFGMLSGLAHDPLQRDIFGALCTGATVVIPSQQQFKAFQFAKWLKQQQVSVLHLTPAMAEIICLEPGVDLSALKVVFLTGERLRRDIAEALLQLNPHLQVYNCFGATETQRAATYFQVVVEPGAEAVIPVSLATPDTRIRLINAADQNCGLGEVGMICTESSRIARGYLNDDSLTSQRFMNLNAIGLRRYNTGDLGVCLDGQSILYLGREDKQINLRGFRVELGEIEHQIKQHPKVDSCATVVHQQANVIAYVSCHGVLDAQPLVADLTDFIQQHLPEHMRPSAIMVVDHIPLTANNKVDYRALPDPVEALQSQEYEPPRGDTELRLASIWGDLLQQEPQQISATANFFELGGHSLLLLKLLAAIRVEFAQEVELKWLFDCTHLRSLAGLLDGQMKQTQLSDALSQADADDIDEVEL